MGESRKVLQNLLCFCQGFCGDGNVWCKIRVVELIELVEFYWESWKAFMGESRQVLWKTCYLRREFRNFWPPEVLN